MPSSWPGVDVLRVLAEGHDVELARILQGRWLAGIPLHRPNSGKERQDLTQGRVQAANPSAHRRRKGAHDCNLEFADGLDSIGGQPLSPAVASRLAFSGRVSTRRKSSPHPPAVAIPPSSSSGSRCPNGIGIRRDGEAAGRVQPASSERSTMVILLPVAARTRQ